MPRPDGRANDQLRAIEIIPHFQKHPHGSVLIKTGDTWVLCSAFAEDGAPPFITDPGRGWVTAEYSMLPGATTTRGRRSAGGRVKEIQRLVGRSLRAAIDLSRLGPRTITVDCDVLQADGGTRVASITGGYVAMALAIRALRERGALVDETGGLSEPVAAISVGLIDGELRLDLPYAEDATADVDMNVVMTESGKLIEVQGTAEGAPFSRDQLNGLLDLAHRGIRGVCAAQRAILE